MNYGLYISAMGLKAQQAKQGVIANNIANAGTVGFKRDLAIMQSRANAVNEDPRMAKYRLPIFQDQGGGVFAKGGGIDLTQGFFRDSDKQTDLALKGSGFFTVRGEKGETLLTRDGSFLINKDGQLVTESGLQVLDEAGAPISLAPGLKVHVSEQGKITQGEAIGDGGVKLGVVDVADSRQLRKIGKNLLSVQKPEALAAAGPETRVLQNRLEESSVDPTIEMVNMMEGLRIFEANAKMISYQDTTMSQLNTIGRVA